MPSTQITIPDFDFSGFYYPQLLEALVEYKRRNVPELTDESAYEPFIQFLRATALVGHINNVLIDLVANESTLPTAKLVETVRNMLRLIDYELRPATPSQADIVFELAKVFTVATEIIPSPAQIATERQGSNPVIYFESLESLTVDPTDELSYVLAEEDGTFTDFTTQANDPTTPASDWTPWATPDVGDAIYFGHKHVMFDVLSITGITAIATNITGTWEVYDGDPRDEAPAGVTDLGGSLEFDLTTLLGTQNRQGTEVRVQLNETAVYEDVVSTWNGSKNIATTGLLSQTSPSTDATDYTVGSMWKILDDVTDNPSDFTDSAGGKVEYNLPQNQNTNWQQVSVDSKTAFWLRYRIVLVSTPTSPTIQGVRIDEGKQYVIRSATQGQTRVEDPLGSSSGLPNQEFVTGKDYFVVGSQTVTVDGDEWTEVSNFLNSAPGDKHYTIELGTDDRATIKFGDGANGRIPAIGIGNIAIIYRHGAQDDGNVGSDTIVVDKTGLNFVSSLFNPRQASGWEEAQGASEASLERAKVEGPSTLRTKEVALGPNDVEDLAVAFVDDDGASPFSRARAFEEGYGPKTIQLVVVAAGGGLASPTQLANIEEYFNGNSLSVPQKDKHLVANQEVTAINYTQRTIDVTATVYGDVEEEEVINRLLQILQPEALKEDGVNYEWKFGGEVADSRINHEIFSTDESITKVDLTVPAAPIALLPRELPVAGTLNITVVNA